LKNVFQFQALIQVSQNTRIPNSERGREGPSGARKILRKKNSLFLNQSLIIIQSDHRYCQYNNEGGNKIILPLFKSYLCYCESLWQHFPPVLLKLQLYHLGSNIPSPSCTPTRRSRSEILWTRGALPHVSPYTTQYQCIQYRKINTPISQNFSLNHRMNT
jgi:hypothetical protein